MNTSKYSVVNTAITQPDRVPLQSWELLPRHPPGLRLPGAFAASLVPHAGRFGLRRNDGLSSSLAARPRRRQGGGKMDARGAGHTVRSC
ncbi:hypothetical protein [Acidithrix sp. C25]|uniref:hypothetical protein n=1 Tax=Acidithrix sp. C25 TaxID=1671482 RepID=UPI001BD103C6|nr:hypothetical protein [Acidithrix sp. C25]